MYIVAFFIIAPNWKQPKRLEAAEWVNKLLFIFGISLSSKKQWFSDINCNMDESYTHHAK